MFREKSVLQATLLFISTAIGMGLGFVNSILIARLLGASLYGDFKFIQTVWFFFSLIFSFGFFHAASRVIVLETAQEALSEATGATLLISFGVSFLMLLASIVLSAPIDLMFHTHLAPIFVVLSPLLLAFSLQNALQLLLQANNKIALLSVLTLLPQFINTIITAAMLKFGLVSVLWVLVVQLTSILMISALIFWRLHPTFLEPVKWIQKIFYENKRYGIEIYKGSLGAVGSSQFNRLAVAYWVDNTALGFLSLAIVLTEPLKLLPNVIATSSFRKFAENKEINRNILSISVLVSVISLISAILFYEKFLYLLYPKGFEAVGPMAIALSFGAIIHGFGDFYNRFLGAQGEGKAIRDSAYLVAVVNILGVVIL
jgi:O-antigen/teichoic acid export membrane protein